MTQTQKLAARRRWQKQRERELLNKDDKMAQVSNEEASWLRAHRAHIERRNRWLKGIGASALVLGLILGVAGYLNYLVLLTIPTAYLAQFFVEIGILVPIIFINTKIIIKVGGDNADAAFVAAFVALAAALAAFVAAFVAAVALAVAAVTAVVTAVALAVAAVDSKR